MNSTATLSVSSPNQSSPNPGAPSQCWELQWLDDLGVHWYLRQAQDQEACREAVMEYSDEPARKYNLLQLFREGRHVETILLVADREVVHAQSYIDTTNNLMTNSAIVFWANHYGIHLYH